MAQPREFTVKKTQGEDPSIQAGDIINVEATILGYTRIWQTEYPPKSGTYNLGIFLFAKDSDGVDIKIQVTMPIDRKEKMDNLKSLKDKKVRISAYESAKVGFVGVKYKGVTSYKGKDGLEKAHHTISVTKTGNIVEI